MAKKTYMKRKGNRFYFRRNIPVGLARKIGKYEIYKMLPDCSYYDAMYLCRELAQETERLFKNIMSENELTKEQFEQHAKRMFNGLIDDFELSKKDLTPQGVIKAQERVEGARTAMATNADASGLVNAYIHEHSLQITDNDLAYDQLCEIALRAYAEASYIHSERFQGNYRVKAEDPLFSTAELTSSDTSKEGVPVMTIKEAAENLKKEKMRNEEWRSEMVRETKNSFDLAFEYFGEDMPLNALTRSAVSKFKDDLALLPKLRGKVPQLSNKPIRELIDMATEDVAIQRVSQSTIGKHLKNLSALLKWAKTNGYIDENPAEGIGPKRNRNKAAKDERKAFTLNQLETWFSSPFYTGCKNQARRKEPGVYVIKDSLYWMPLIAAYHPMRAEEIAQMFVHDIKEEEGIYFFDIDGGLTTEDVEATGKQIKSPAAKRRVPVHSLLIKAGFIKYVEGVRKIGDERVFNELKTAGVAGRYSQQFLKKFSRYLKQLGVEGVSFHSLRHTSITALFDKSANESLNKYLSGHEQSGETGRYFKGGSLPSLKKAIDCIEYPNIDAKFILQPTD